MSHGMREETLTIYSINDLSTASRNGSLGEHAERRASEVEAEPRSYRVLSTSTGRKKYTLVRLYFLYFAFVCRERVSATRRVRRGNETSVDLGTLTESLRENSHWC